jgi:hypothetical protein
LRGRKGDAERLRGFDADRKLELDRLAKKTVANFIEKAFATL